MVDLKIGKKMHTLTFEIAKPNVCEKHTVDLHNKQDKIEFNEVAMGFDGNEIWLTDEQNTSKGNPVVYHNLMFYFYAMPFVLGDPGINYETAEDLIYEGKTYPGFHISYDENIRASPKDDYYLNYDPDTYQMARLGYTFTYGSDKKSDSVRWTRYKEWMEVGDIVLLEYLTWHSYEGRNIKEAQDPFRFLMVSLDASPKQDIFYTRPKNAKVVLKP